MKFSTRKCVEVCFENLFWSCDYVTLLDLLGMPSLSNIGVKPWGCVCCSISLQADLYTLPAQPYSNALCMPITIKHCPTCGPSSTSPLQPVQRLVHAISNWELERSPLWSKWHEFYTLFQAHLQHYNYYSFVLFAVHIIYQSPHIDCPFLFIFLHS